MTTPRIICKKCGFVIQEAGVKLGAPTVEGECQTCWESEHEDALLEAQAFDGKRTSQERKP